MPTVDELRTLIVGCSETVTGGVCNVSEECAFYQTCGPWEDCNGCGANVGPTEGCYWKTGVGFEGMCEHWVNGLTVFWSSTRWRTAMYGFFVDFRYAQAWSVQCSEEHYARCIRDNV